MWTVSEPDGPSRRPGLTPMSGHRGPRRIVLAQIRAALILSIIIRVQWISLNTSQGVMPTSRAAAASTRLKKAAIKRLCRPAGVGLAYSQTGSIGTSTATTRDEEPTMTPPEQAPTPGTREHFLQVSQLQRWGTIQEYVDLCRTHGYFTSAF